MRTAARAACAAATPRQALLAGERGAGCQVLCPAARLHADEPGGGLRRERRLPFGARLVGQLGDLHEVVAVAGRVEAVALAGVVLRRWKGGGGSGGGV